MALIGAVYKWRLDCDSYVYITDTNGSEALIITNECIDENTIKDIVATWDEKTYCERFTKMVNYVHSFEKWKDLRFLDCNVYLKEYYGCDEMLRPAFPTGIQLNLSATTLEYYVQPEATVLDVKCITRDGEKITAYDINFGIPRGIPGLTIKGSWTPSTFFSQPFFGDINDGYIINRNATLSELPQGAKKGDLWICTQNSDLSNGKIAVYEFSGVNLCGPAGEADFRYNEALNSYSFGDNDSATGVNSFSCGSGSTASGQNSFSQGSGTTASGVNSHVEGLRSQAIGRQSHAEGTDTLAKANQSHTEGYGTQALANGGHAEGDSTIAYGCYSHTEGANTVTGSQYGNPPTVNDIGLPSNNNDDNGGYAHAEGASTIAYGKGSHSEGIKTMAIGVGSHAEGIGNVAINEGQHVSGLYATIDETGEYLFQIGFGMDENNREDAFVIKKDGTVIIYTTE